jgi:hypothetical protein
MIAEARKWARTMGVVHEHSRGAPTPRNAMETFISDVGDLPCGGKQFDGYT